MAKYIWKFRTAASDKQRKRYLVNITNPHKTGIHLWESCYSTFFNASVIGIRSTFRIWKNATSA